MASGMGDAEVVLEDFTCASPTSVAGARRVFRQQGESCRGVLATSTIVLADAARRRRGDSRSVGLAVLGVADGEVERARRC